MTLRGSPVANLAEDRTWERARVIASQRARILDALADVVAARGWRRTTIAAVSTQASVSPATFTDIFSDLDAAFVSLVRQVTVKAVSLLRDAFEREPTWQLGVIGALESLTRFFDAEPSLARVWLVEANAGPPEALEQRVQLLGPLLALIDEGRNVLPGRREPPSFAAEALVASMIGILHTRLVTAKAPPFVRLLGELTALLVAPFLDRVEADQVVQQAEDRYRANMGKPAAAPVRRTTNVPKQLRHGNARQARACLLFIAQHPGASNQDVAFGLGVTHHGQISSLLARLYRLGMLTKVAGGAGRPNAWTLSDLSSHLIGWLEAQV